MYSWCALAATVVQSPLRYDPALILFLLCLNCNLHFWLYLRKRTPGYFVYLATCSNSRSKAPWDRGIVLSMDRLNAKSVTFDRHRCDRCLSDTGPNSVPKSPTAGMRTCVASKIFPRWVIVDLWVGPPPMWPTATKTHALIIFNPSAQENTKRTIK